MVPFGGLAFNFEPALLATHLADIVGVVDAVLLPAQAVKVTYTRSTGIGLDSHHLLRCGQPG